MKVNIRVAKNQLSKLVKDAVAGEEVVITVNGEPMVKLAPIARKGRLPGWGKLKRFKSAIDAAFSREVDEQIAKGLEGQV